MERDLLLPNTFFMREKFLTSSDDFTTGICIHCGFFTSINAESRSNYCNLCKTGDNTTQVRIPYCVKLLSNELAAMGIAMKFKIKE